MAAHSETFEYFLPLILAVFLLRDSDHFGFDAEPTKRPNYFKRAKNVTRADKQASNYPFQPHYEWEKKMRAALALLLDKTR